jgi:hypothetical protein
MHQQPPVQKTVHSPLLVELTLLFADIFEIVDGRMEPGRKKDAHLTKHGLRPLLFRKRRILIRMSA